MTDLEKFVLALNESEMQKIELDSLRTKLREVEGERDAYIEDYSKHKDIVRGLKDRAEAAEVAKLTEMVRRKDEALGVIRDAKTNRHGKDFDIIDARVVAHSALAAAGKESGGIK